MILSSVRFLARQGLALRGDASDASANLIQLLRLRAEDKPEVLQWLDKSAHKHTSPENQNEMLELMAHSVLRRILANIHSSPFLAVMVDETKIAELEPRAVFTHCYGHALHLVISDTIKQSQVMKDYLDTCYELVKLVKFSPKPEAMLRQLKEETGSHAPGVRTLCPTRWTVQAESLSSVIANYNNIKLLWETALHATSDSEMKARIHGMDSQMQSFKFLFGLVLSETILRHTDKLSQTLQQPQLSSVEGHGVAMLTVKTLESLQTSGNFDLFWQKLEKTREELDVDKPEPARRRKVPKRFEQGSAPPEFPVSLKDEYRQVYFEALDLAVTSIRSRFDQKGFKTYSNVEQLLFKASEGQCLKDELDQVCTFFYGDFNKKNW